MKKIGLICATLIVSLSLAGCNNLASQQSHKASSSSSTKVVKHHKHHKKTSSQSKASSLSSSSNSSSSTAVSQAQSTSSTTNQSQGTASGKQFNKSDPNTWHDIPYKGYPSYDAYCEANGGDPEVQAETASMQHAENVKQGIENPDGSETQNFQNWVSARDNAWDNGNDDFPSYDQNQQW